MELATLKQAYKRHRFPTESAGGKYQNLDQDDDHNHDTAYGGPEIAQAAHPHDTERRSWLRTLLIQIPFLLWLAPILVLLYLNLHGYIIGASAWCPKGRCKFDAFDLATSLQQARLAKYDRDNHNLLGTLQLVAKALEIWFIFIASWLVYNVTIILAGRPSGLQLAYLIRPSEFTDIPAMFDPVLWQALPSRPLLGRSGNGGGASNPREGRWRVWVFLLFTICLGILCNLIGPAVAVLVLPSLQWQTTPNVADRTFGSIGAENPPSADSLSLQPLCKPEQVSAQEYSCGRWNGLLDGWLQSCLEQRYQTGVTYQDSLSFALNNSFLVTRKTHKYSDVVTWAPNRLILHSLYNDWNALSQIANDTGQKHSNFSETYETYLPYENSIQTFILRNGPILGAVANMWVGYNNRSHFDTVINKDSTLRCFQNYSLSHTPLYPNSANGTFTKCITMGKGWNRNFRRLNFSVEGLYKPWLKNGLGPAINLDVYTSDRAAFLPHGNVPAGFDHRCLAHGHIAEGVSCDWDLFFTPHPDVEIRSSHITTIQMTTESAPLQGYPITVDFAVDFVTLFNFTEYSLDPAVITNPLAFVTTLTLPSDGAAKITLDPAWILAAYGVDAGGTLGANTSSTLALQNVLGNLWAAYPNLSVSDPITEGGSPASCAAVIPIIHAMSLVDYTTNKSSPGVRQNNQADHPPLYRLARIYVWAYAMSSRTAYFGVVICCLGMTVVLLQTALALKTRNKFYSPVQLLVAALEYKYSTEFSGMEHSEKAVAGVPFRVEPVEHAVSEFGFSRVD